MESLTKDYLQRYGQGVGKSQGGYSTQNLVLEGLSLKRSWEMAVPELRNAQRKLFWIPFPHFWPLYYAVVTPRAWSHTLGTQVMGDGGSRT